MFVHEHPYSPFIKHDTEKLIVGTLPPPRFSTGELLEQDVDFCYGSYFNSLWLFIEKIHNLNFRYDNSEEAIAQRKQFLIKNRIGVCDIVASCEREKIDASDLGMSNVKLRDIVGYLKQYPNIKTILFTGGNSKNGPEYFFRKYLKKQSAEVKLKIVSNKSPRVHQFILDGRSIKTVSLIAPSGAANISIGSSELYKELKKKNPEFNTLDFRVLQYKEFF